MAELTRLLFEPRTIWQLITFITTLVLLSSKGSRDANNPNTISIDFSKLFGCLRLTLESDEGSTLLLYLMLHRNADFRSYLFASSDIDLVSS